MRLREEDAAEVLEDLGVALDGLAHDGEHNIIVRAADDLRILDLLSCLALVWTQMSISWSCSKSALVMRMIVPAQQRVAWTSSWAPPAHTTHAHDRRQTTKKTAVKTAVADAPFH